MLKENELEILNQGKILYSSTYDNIEEYNIYNFIGKRGGYILRMKSKNASFFSLLTWEDFNNVNDIDLENFNYIVTILAEKTKNIKKTSTKDVFLKIFSSLPYFFLLLAVLALVGIFIYIIYYIE